MMTNIIVIKTHSIPLEAVLSCAMLLFLSGTTH